MRKVHRISSVVESNVRKGAARGPIPDPSGQRRCDEDIDPIELSISAGHCTHIDITVGNVIEGDTHLARRTN